MSFASDIQDMKNTEIAYLDIDVSTYMGKEEGSRILRFRKPSLPAISKLSSRSDWLKLQFCNEMIEPEDHWGDDLIFYVATLMCSFVPACLPKEDQLNWQVSFAHLFTVLPMDDFDEIIAKYRQMFPNVLPTQAAVTEQKND